VYVVHCFNFHCLHIEHCIVIVMHVSGQYWPFAFILITKLTPSAVDHDFL